MYHEARVLNEFVFMLRAWCLQGTRALVMPTYEIQERLEWLRFGFFDRFPEFKETGRIFTSAATPRLFHYLAFTDETRKLLYLTYVQVLRERQASGEEIAGELQDELDNLTLHGNRPGTGLPYGDAKAVRIAAGAEENLIPDLSTFMSELRPWSRSGDKATEIPTDELLSRLKWLCLGFFERNPEFQDQEKLMTPEFVPELFEYLSFAERIRIRLRDAYLRILSERRLSEGETVVEDDLQILMILSEHLPPRIRTVPRHRHLGDRTPERVREPASDLDEAKYHLAVYKASLQFWCERAGEASFISTGELTERIEWLNGSFFNHYSEYRDRESQITPKLFSRRSFYRSSALIDMMRQKLKDAYLRILDERQDLESLSQIF